MSTRAQIVVEGIEEVKFYKHSDGYPIGVLPVLEPFLKGFLKRRGWDPEYLLARLVMAFGRSDDPGEVLGYGLMPYWAPDLDYWYRIREDGVIECWRTRESWWDASLEEGFRPEKHSKRVTPKDWREVPWARRLGEAVEAMLAR